MKNTTESIEMIRLRAAAQLELRRREKEEFEAELIKDPIAWIKHHYYIPETNAPMELYPLQEIPTSTLL